MGDDGRVTMGEERGVGRECKGRWWYLVVVLVVLGTEDPDEFIRAFAIMRYGITRVEVEP